MDSLIDRESIYFNPSELPTIPQLFFLPPIRPIGGSQQHVE